VGLLQRTWKRMLGVARERLSSTARTCAMPHAHLHRDWAHPMSHLHRDRDRLPNLCRDECSETGSPQRQ